MNPGERMTVRCPHCDRPFGGIRFGLRWGALAVRIIDTVKRAGNDGVGYDELYEQLYSSRASRRTALKGHIFQINQRLGKACDLQISGRGGRYHIASKPKRDAA